MQASCLNLPFLLCEVGKEQKLSPRTHPLNASSTSRRSPKKQLTKSGRTPQRNASSFARSRRRSTHNSAVLRAYGAGGDGETSGANPASESIGNQEPLRHESSLGQAVEMAADGMPSCATQVRGSSVGMVLTCAVKRLLVMNISVPDFAYYLPLPFCVSPTVLPFPVRKLARRKAQRLGQRALVSKSMRRSLERCRILRPHGRCRMWSRLCTTTTCSFRTQIRIH